MCLSVSLSLCVCVCVCVFITYFWFVVTMSSIYLPIIVLRHWSLNFKCILTSLNFKILLPSWLLFLTSYFTSFCFVYPLTGYFRSWWFCYFCLLTFSLACTWLIYYLYCIFAFIDELFPFIIFMFLVVAFSFSVWNPFNISCRPGLGGGELLQLLPVCKTLDLSTNLKENHVGSSILGSTFSPFVTLNISCHSLLTF